MPRQKENKLNIWELIDGPGVRVDRFSPDNADAIRMMEHLASQEKIRTRVPREPKEAVDAVASPVMNGVRINILKGVSVNLPEDVANLIEKSYYDTDKAMSPKIKNVFSGKESEARLDLKSDAEMAQL